MIKSSGMQHIIFLSKNSILEDLQTISMHNAEDLFRSFAWTLESTLSGKRSALDSESLQDTSCTQRMKIRVPVETKDRCEVAGKTCVNEECDVDMLQNWDGPEATNNPDPDSQERSACPSVETHHLCWIFFTSGELADMHQHYLTTSPPPKCRDWSWERVGA
jgi:hypothetical protein